MSTLDNEIRSRVESFVAEISSLIRQAAVDAAVNALRGQGGAGLGYTGAKRGPKPGMAAARRAAAAGGGRVRRTEAQIQQTMSKVLSYIESNSGSRSEEIRASLNLTAPQTADSLKRLLAEKSIKSKGQRRGTTYSKG